MRRLEGVGRIVGTLAVATALLGRPSSTEAASPSPRPIVSETTISGNTNGLTPENILLLSLIIVVGAACNIRETRQLYRRANSQQDGNPDIRNS